MTFPLQDLIVAKFIAQLPLAPNGVTSFVAPFKLRVHLDASVNAVEASETLAPIAFVTHSSEWEQSFLLLSASSLSGYSCRPDCIISFESRVQSLGRLPFLGLPRSCLPQEFLRYSEICTLRSYLRSGG